MTAVQYHLGKFPPKNLDWARLVPAIGRAHSSMAAYGAMLESIPNTGVLISPLATQEAVYSNRIDGTQTTLTQVLTFQADEKHSVDDPVKRNDAHEVVNYRVALDTAIGQLEQIPLSLRLIRDAHRILMRGVRGQDKGPRRTTPPGHPKVAGETRATVRLRLAFGKCKPVLTKCQDVA